MTGLEGNIWYKWNGIKALMLGILTGPHEMSVYMRTDLTVFHACFLQEHINEYPNDPQADREVIESIETVYYNDETFDASEYELNKLPGTLEMIEINKDRERLRRQHQAVSLRYPNRSTSNYLTRGTSPF